MIAKDVNTLNLIFCGASFGSDLSNSSVMIKSSEASDVLFLNCFSKVTEDHSICIGRVCHHQTFNIGMSKFEGFRLIEENQFVQVKQILSLHSRLSGLTSDENNNIGIFEHLFRLISELNLSQIIVTDFRRGKLQSWSSSATPCRTLTAGVISSSLRWMLTPGKIAPLQSCGRKE